MLTSATVDERAADGQIDLSVAEIGSRPMLRRALYWPLVLLWSGIVLPLATLTGVLTLGRLSHRVVDLWAPIWARGMLAIAGVRLEVRGREHLEPLRSRVMVMNHSSFLDMQAAGAFCPPGAMALVKKEFAWIPLLGMAMWATGQVFVDRKNHARAQRSVARLEEALRKNVRTVLVFPEGTRSRTGELLPFKLGAFRIARDTGLPLIPAVLHGAYALQRPDEWLPRPGALVLELYPEISPAGWTDEELPARAAALRAWYAERLASGPGSPGSPPFAP